jgi:hypothetical protein
LPSRFRLKIRMKNCVHMVSNAAETVAAVVVIIELY